MTAMSIQETSLRMCNRDPTELDFTKFTVVWISLEYLPHRVFQGEEGKWKFIGKFTPVKEEKCDQD